MRAPPGAASQARFASGPREDRDVDNDVEEVPRTIKPNYFKFRSTLNHTMSGLLAEMDPWQTTSLKY